jgi:hypothetical protein
VKWTYKGCDVTITPLLDKLRQTLTPFVEIIYKSADGKQTILSTSQRFTSAAMAEHCGQNMAREWIDENVRD